MMTRQSDALGGGGPFLQVSGERGWLPQDGEGNCCCSKPLVSVLCCSSPRTPHADRGTSVHLGQAPGSPLRVMGTVGACNSHSLGSCA